VIATAQDALEAAATQARMAGVTPSILSDRIDGQARNIGVMDAARQ
jgi:glycerate 2-kinase